MGQSVRATAALRTVVAVIVGWMIFSAATVLSSSGQESRLAVRPQDGVADMDGRPSYRSRAAGQSQEGETGQGAQQGERQAPLVPMTVTVVRALDKITARSSLIDLPEDRPVRFGTLEIVARHCESRPPEDEPETAAFLEIWDNRGGRHEKIFSGWMLASSPALHALAHPVYDLWVIACKTTAGGALSGKR